MQRTVRTVRSLLITTIFIITFLLYAGLAVACYDPGEDTGNGSSNDSQRLTIYYDKLMVGSDATYPPFEYVEDGKVMGFDIDIATEIALRLEKEIEIVPITWDCTYEIPEDLKLDMIISAVSVDEEKEELADFSDPYYEIEYMLISLSEVELKIKEDLYVHREALEDLRKRLVAFLEEHNEITTPQFKDMTGTSRKYTIPLIEYFDREHVTVRVGDSRLLRKK